MTQSQALQTGIRATFWRGGTSRGLIFLASRLAPFTQETRDAIICAAMGSPDPDGRQIDGLGGGASSLSKVAVINAPGRGGVSVARSAGNRFPGVPWSEDNTPTSAAHPVTGWDVVYRFGQVPINGTKVDWASTCGNLVAAVAQHSINTRTMESYVVSDRAKAAGVDPEDPNARFMCPVRILQAESGNRVLASVAVSRLSENRWGADTAGEATIAGVPGKHASTVIETQLQGTLLPTSRTKDTVMLGTDAVEVSIVDAGLPVIFVRASDLGVDFDQLTSHPASLDADLGLMQRIEALRKAASSLEPSLTGLYFPGSAAPKVCLLHPRATYRTTGSTEVRGEEVDCLARAVSVGQFHRTIPATTLSALGAASALGNTVVSDVVKEGGASIDTPPPAWALASTPSVGHQIVSFSVGQPAGISSTCLRMSKDPSPVPEAILMERTARQLMDGDILIPESVGARFYAPFTELYESKGKPMPKPRGTKQPKDKEQAQRELLKQPWQLHISDEKLTQRSERPYTRGSRQTQTQQTGKEPAFRNSPSTSAARNSTGGALSPSRGRGYATKSGQIGPALDIESRARLHLYRHLSRAITRHTTLDGPARSNLHRLMREDFVAAAASGSVGDLEKRVEATLLLFLAAAEKDPSSTREADLLDSQPISPTTAYQPLHHVPQKPFARRILDNLSSLTYHHLSPNTVMLSKRNPRLTGGSNSHAARQSRASLGSAPSESETLAMSLLAEESAGDFDGTGRKPIAGPQRLLMPLSTIPRPARGPVQSNRASGAADERVLPWDGQRPMRSLERVQVNQEASLLEERFATLQRDLAHSEQPGSSKSMTQLQRQRKQREAKEIKGLLKGVRKKDRAVLEARRVQDEARCLLLQLVRGAELGVRAQEADAGAGGGGAKGGDPTPMGPLMGGARWQKWIDRKFLAP